MGLRWILVSDDQEERMDGGEGVKLPVICAFMETKMYKSCWCSSPILESRKRGVASMSKFLPLRLYGLRSKSHL